MLNTGSTFNSSMAFVVYDNNNCRPSQVSSAEVLSYFQKTFAAPGMSVNVYTPGTGFNISMPTPVSQGIWALIQPAGTLATGTITAPLNTLTPDGTEILATTTQQITAFTFGLNGAAASYGAPTTLAANAFFKMRFYQPTNSWYRIG